VRGGDVQPRSEARGARPPQRTDVKQLLRENRTRLDSLARALLDHETLDEADAYAAAGLRTLETQGIGSQALAAFRRRQSRTV